MEERATRPEPGGLRPPIDPPVRTGLGGAGGFDDGDEWRRLHEALRVRTGAERTPVELLGEQHDCHGMIFGSGFCHPDWPFDSWLVRALAYLPEMPFKEAQALAQLIEWLPCTTLHKQIQLERAWVDRRTKVEIVPPEDRQRIEDMEQALMVWDNMLRVVEARLREFPGFRQGLVFHPWRAR